MKEPLTNTWAEEVADFVIVAVKHHGKDFHQAVRETREATICKQRTFLNGVEAARIELEAEGLI